MIFYAVLRFRVTPRCLQGYSTWKAHVRILLYRVSNSPPSGADFDRILHSVDTVCYANGPSGGLAAFYSDLSMKSLSSSPAIGSR